MWRKRINSEVEAEAFSEQLYILRFKHSPERKDGRSKIKEWVAG